MALEKVTGREHVNSQHCVYCRAIHIGDLADLVSASMLECSEHKCLLRGKCHSLRPRVLRLGVDYQNRPEFIRNIHADCGEGNHGYNNFDQYHR